MASIGNVRVTRAGIIFIIVVVVLGILVFAGVSIVKQRGEQVRRDEAAKIAGDTLEKESQEPIAIAEGVQSQAVTSTAESESSSATTSDATASSTQLPETGVELVNVMVIAVLAGVATYFVALRRTVREL